MLKRLILTILVVPLMAFASPVKEALIVGVSKYKYDNITRLDGVVIDVKQMKRLLESRGFNVKVLFNEEATVSNVQSALDSYSNLSKDDSFLLYTSSHGTQIDDKNGDEADGKDEAYVLYETETDDNGAVKSMIGLLVDDDLENMLSKISAKKFLITDACHSGSMYKSFNSNVRSKSLKLSSNFTGKGVLGKIYKPRNLIVLGATEDNEEALDTDEGGMFTGAIYDAWSTNQKITFQDIKDKVSVHIENSCTPQQVFHPTLYSTNNNFINISIDDFMNVNINITPKKALLEEYFDHIMTLDGVKRMSIKSSKRDYAVGDKINFTIDTNQESGYLYVLEIKESDDEINVLYPNPYSKINRQDLSSRFSFPKRGDGFVFKASNSARGVERTVVYSILSKDRIDGLELSKESNQFQIIKKDFDGQFKLKNTFKNIIVKKKEDKGISIAKTIFNTRG